MEKKEIIIGILLTIGVTVIAVYVLSWMESKPKYYVEQDIFIKEYELHTSIYREWRSLSDTREKTWIDKLYINKPSYNDSIKCVRYNAVKVIADEMNRIDRQKCK